jgi:hypothetical protein
MATTLSMPVNCPNCGSRFNTPVEQIIDIRKNPAAKPHFLAGQVNVGKCPNCKTVFQVATPFAYHDPSKELLLIHVPMELNMHRDEQERLVGQLTRTITDDLPMEMRKGYLLNPRRTFTMQGMIDTVLELDGITKEMIAARREKMQLVQSFLQTKPEDLPELAQKNDEKLDEEFFRLLTAVAEIALNNRDQTTSEKLLIVRDMLLEHSTYGKKAIERAQKQEDVIRRVSEDLQKLGRRATRDKLLDLLMKNDEEDEYIQAFVGLARPVLDYEFLTLLGEKIDEARNAKIKKKLTTLRDRIVQLTEEIDRHRQAVIQQSANILQEIINSPDIERAIMERLPLLDDTFMAVLEANLGEAQRRNNAVASQRLQTVYETLMQLMQQSSPPEIQFINQLLQIEDEMERRLLLVEKVPEFGAPLLEYVDNLIEDLNEQGAKPLAERLTQLRQEVARVILSN